MESAALLGREIEATLTTVSGVLEARVHLQLPQRDPFFGETLPGGGKGSAAVLLITDDSFSLGKEAVSALVAGAADIPAERIAAIMVPAGAVQRGSDSAAGAVDGARREASREALPPGTASPADWLRRLVGKLLEKPLQTLCSLLIVSVGAALIWISQRNRRRLRFSRLEGLFEKGG